MILSLTFLSTDAPELAEITFSPTAGDDRVARRGKGLVYTDDQGSFQWTKAVKAFALLCVGTKLAQFSESPFELAGENATPAASLDYAISKPTDWIADIFGGKSEARDYRRTVFRITNSEQKLPGPVSIRLSSSLQEVSSIKIFLDDTEVSSAFEVLSLFEKIGGNNFPTNEKQQEAEPILSMQHAAHIGELGTSKVWYESEAFYQAVSNEVIKSLHETEVIETLGIVQAEERLKEWRNEEQYKALTPAFLQIRSKTPPPHKLYATQEFSDLKDLATPLKIGCPPMAMATLLLLRSLVTDLGIPLEIYSHHSSSSSILSSIEEERLDYVILSWGAVEKLLLSQTSKKKNDALMLMPRTSIDLMVPKVHLNNLPNTELYVSTDASGSPYQYFEAIKRSKDSRWKNTIPVNASIVEIIARLTKDASCAVVSFPFSGLLNLYFGYEVQEVQGAVKSRVGDNVLVSVNQLKKDDTQPTQLAAAIRAAWYMLLEDSDKLAFSVRSLISDTNYIKSLKRLGGLYRIAS